MTHARTKFGVDLITFYNPAHWGLETYEDLVELAGRDPIAVWERIFDGLSAAGISALELTFPPADWRCAERAYGSARAFGAELARRGLELKSGFYIALDWTPGTDRAAAAADAAEYAHFIHEAGGDVLVVGVPLRRSRDADPPLFVDGPYMTAIADLLHVVGDATLREGVRTAVHTEAHSIFCTRRDVNLLMSLTDPTYVFLCPDSAHISLAGGDPAEVLEPHRERIILSHWKDAISAPPVDVPIDEHIHESHREYFRRVGAGSIDWFSWARLMRDAGAADVALLELDAVPDPVAEITAARQFIEGVITAVRSSAG